MSLSAIYVNWYFINYKIIHNFWFIDIMQLFYDSI